MRDNISIIAVIVQTQLHTIAGFGFQDIGPDVHTARSGFGGTGHCDPLLSMHIIDSVDIDIKCKSLLHGI